MIKIFATNQSNRLKYILDLLITDMLGLEYILTRNTGSINVESEPVINYSDTDISGAFKIMPCGLLFKNGIVAQELSSVKQWHDLPVFFETSGGDIPFDLFAASFFLVSRYEEYLPFAVDAHGRFPSSASYAGKQSFLHLPVINMWVQKLAEKLSEKFPDIDIKPQSFDFLSTIDIDYAWAFLNKSSLRSMMSILKSLLKANIREFRLKVNVLQGKTHDPYDTYPEWSLLHEGTMEKVIVFFLVSSATPYDMVINPDNIKWQNLVKELSQKYSTGLHPSYDSGTEHEIVLKEKQFLESLCGRPITRSRQHFIKLRMPATYRTLINAGITKDFSMGFHDRTGFRAGIAYPFKFFDLEKNESTDLMIYPFCVMERTLKDYMGYDSFSSLGEINKLISQVKSCGGLFISIWHNNSLGDYGEWEGWKNTYKQMIDLCKKARS